MVETGFKAPEKREEAGETELKQFLESRTVRSFTEEWHKEGYTKAGIHELLTELHIRFSGDEKKTLDRGHEILAILKNIDLGKFKIKPEGLLRGLKNILGGQ
ncbi:MAG: hypothetical protein NTY83_01890 [Candidatus Micrarchaeota archaeon]|nr:hypothetical protein [Candidatus Micrarchaeota archaeon]